MSREDNDNDDDDDEIKLNVLLRLRSRDAVVLWDDITVAVSVAAAAFNGIDSSRSSFILSPPLNDDICSSVNLPQSHFHFHFQSTPSQQLQVQL